MIAILRVARADLRQRTRTFGIVVVIAAALQLGYLWVPDATAPYAVINLGGWRGVYDSAWMGATTALLTVMFLPLFGFFLVRPALSRDARLGTYELVAAAPMPRRAVVFGKWLSNVALLAGIGAVLVVAAVAMQLVRGESRAIDAGAFLLPYALLTVPACAVVAAIAVLIDAVPWLRGVGGAIVAICSPSALIIGSIGVANGVRVAPFDPLGITIVSSALFASLQAAAPGANAAHDIAIGASEAAHRVFRFSGLVWEPAAVAARLGWIAASAAAVAAVAPFALAAPRRIAARARLAYVPARIAAALPLGRLVRAELVSLLGGAGFWWSLGVVLIAASALVVPVEGVTRAVAPLAWIWPLALVAGAGAAASTANVAEMLRAVAAPAWKRVGARWLACVAIGALPIVALSLRAGSGGIALVAILGAAVALALLCGSLTRSAILFEALAIAAWYGGPVNRIPFLDPALAAHASLAATAIATIIAVAALGATAWREAARV